MAKPKGPVEIEVRSDGIYIIVDNQTESGKVSRKAVLDVLEAFGVKDIDFATIGEIFKSSEPIVEKKISSNTSIVQKKEGVAVTVGKNRMEAYITFSEPVNGGGYATKEDVLKALSDANIKFGISETEIEKTLNKHGFGKPYTVAWGKASISGKDGYLDFGFDTSKKDAKPKLLENGNVDFRSLNLIEMVTAGQRLVTIIPPQDGEDGTDVYGVTLPYKRGKQAPAIVKGAGVSYNSEGTSITADTSGQVLYENRKISVSPILEISGDVDNNTGNISFNGSVVIKGSVRTGFRVEADGNIDVQGAVEGAFLNAGHNILLYSGVQGSEKAEVIAGGDINTKFAQGCTLTAGKDIIANSIMHSNVNCEGKLELAGKNGLLVGGKITVGEKIEARVIGSTMATATEITVGNAPEKLEEYRMVLADFTSKKKEYDKLDVVVSKLSAMHKVSPLPEDKKNLLLKTLHTRNFLRDNLTELQKQLNELVPTMESKKGIIYVYDVVHSGVKIMIGNAVMFVRDDIHCCTLSNVDGKIAIGSAV